MIINLCHFEIFFIRPIFFMTWSCNWIGHILFKCVVLTWSIGCDMTAKSSIKCHCMETLLYSWLLGVLYGFHDILCHKSTLKWKWYDWNNIPPVLIQMYGWWKCSLSCLYGNYFFLYGKFCVFFKYYLKVHFVQYYRVFLNWIYQVICNIKILICHKMCTPMKISKTIFNDI